MLIAAFFISAIVIVSLVSRVWRTTELRTGEITLDPAAERFIDQAARGRALRIIANQPRHCHDAVQLGRLWSREADTISNAVEYAKHRSRSHDAVIRVFDAAGNVIETHQYAGDFKDW